MRVCVCVCVIQVGNQLIGECSLLVCYQHGLLNHTLHLVLNCLTFDFIGTSTDESSDDLCTVQIPTGWRSGSRRILYQ